MREILRVGSFRLLVAWYDLWVGAYYDIGHGTLYICPLPMIVLRFQIGTRVDPAKHRLDRTPTGASNG